MAPATLPRPRGRRARPARPGAGGAPAGPPPRHSRTADRDRRERRIGALALLGSIALHVVLLVLIRFSPGLRPARVGPPPRAEPEEGLRLMQFRAVEGEVDPLTRPDDPESVPRPAARRRAAAPAAPPEAPGDALDAVDRVRMGYARDPRLWRDHGPAYLLPPETAEEAIMRGLLPRLALFNDSVAAEADHARRSTDWTFTDSEGRRWGISPEGIHLGSITLPQSEFNPDESMRREVQAALREWSEIRDQAYRAGLDETFEERVRAIRERVERERAERGQGG